MPISSNDIQEAYNLLDSRITNKSNYPDWFNKTLKNLLTKTVSITEWNQFVNYISNTVSDAKSLVDFLETIKDAVVTIPDKIDKTYYSAGYGIAINQEGVISISLEDADEEGF